MYVAFHPWDFMCFLHHSKDNDVIYLYNDITEMSKQILHTLLNNWLLKIVRLQL